MQEPADRNHERSPTPHRAAVAPATGRVWPFMATAGWIERAAHQQFNHSGMVRHNAQAINTPR